MKRRKIVLAVVAVVVVISLLYFFRSPDAPYTAAVVDAESGKPVEGAIYLAVWWKSSANKEKPWWEGSATVIDRFVEGRTGPDGIINVPGFWRRRIAANPNTLAVYKPGYVLWYQEKIFPTYAERRDFDRSRRVVALERWNKTMSYVAMSNFFITATKGNLTRPLYMSGNRILLNAMQNFEAQHMEQERTVK